MIHRLQSALKFLEINKSEFGRIIGVDPAAANRVLSRKREFKIKEAAQFAAAKGISLDWLMHGRGAMLMAEDGGIQEPRRLSLDDEAREEEEYLRRTEAGYGHGGEYLPTVDGAVPEIDVMVGAGDGLVGEIINLRVGDTAISAHRVVDEWKFPDGYLTTVLDVSARRSLVLPVVGDSMIPTYQPGDKVLVDLSQTEMTIDAVYVISDGESPPQIKRLQRVMFSKPQLVEIISDNRSHKPQTVELALLTIIGRVAGKVSKQ